MDSNYAARYRDLYQQHWWWRARERFILSVIRRHRPRPAGAILDIGCGDGLFFPRLVGFGRVEGIEPDASLVTGRGRQYGAIHAGAFDRSFQPGKQYSLILMLDVLEHLEDPVSALRYAVDLLEPGGVLIVTVPAFRVLWTTHDNVNLHYTRYTRPSLQQVANAAGMRIDAQRYFYHWLFPVKVLLRLKERLRGTRSALPRVPAALPSLLFYGISRLEQLLFGRLALPFGSSLLAVGGRQAEPVLRVPEGGCEQSDAAPEEMLVQRSGVSVHGSGERPPWNHHDP